MILDKHTASKTAELLLQINAIKLRPENPFTWASGWQSPIYCDNRILLSFPVIRNFIKEEIAKQVEELYGKPDIIAGVATGAIGIGALVAEYLGLPFIYVRPEAKSHGRQNQIEGLLEQDQTVVVIEDLISTGKSSLNAVDALLKSGAKVKGMIAIFTYGFDVAIENFKKKGVELHTLSNYETLVQLASDSHYIKEEQLNTLMEWRKNPSLWKP
ncbi:orotate phosphoribosyltransferase [Muriicola sp. SD30]|uniref:orotate phosphoribosyltransferase n=1 Tax=Muriicola sp. SD30 TaxID=3240936 RepID=UPI0035104665